MDIHEDDATNTVVAKLELPWLTSDDISIEIHQSCLTVSGEFDQTDSRAEDGSYAVVLTKCSTSCWCKGEIQLPC